MEDSDNYLYAHSLFPYEELGSIIILALALILSSLFEYNTRIHTNSKSSIARATHYSSPAKESTPPGNTTALLPQERPSFDPPARLCLRKITAHPERSEPNHHR